MRLIIFALALTASFGAAAAIWVPLGKTPDGTEISMDSTSISPRGKYVKAWFMYSYPDERADALGRKHRSYKALTLFDCKERTSATQLAIYYAEPTGSGTVAWTDSVDFDTMKFRDVVPESIGENNLDLICTTQRPSSPSPSASPAPSRPKK
jgi:hypothetical protein